jgi:hypothetical protein
MCEILVCSWPHHTTPHGEPWHIYYYFFTYFLSLVLNYFASGFACTLLHDLGSCKVKYHCRRWVQLLSTAFCGTHSRIWVPANESKIEGSTSIYPFDKTLWQKPNFLEFEKKKKDGQIFLQQIPPGWQHIKEFSFKNFIKKRTFISGL